MSLSESEPCRTEGWDQEKSEYFERVDCPVCGYRAMRYEKGDLVIEQLGDPACPVCAGASGASATSDYGSSHAQADDDAGLGATLVGFGGLSFFALFIWISLRLFGGL